MALALHARGYKIASLIDENGGRALSISKTVGCDKVGVVLDDLALSSDIIFITVRDDKIRGIVSEILKNKKIYFKKMMVIHCSGVLSSAVLEPLRKKGALTGSMHPLQAFPSSQTPSKLKGKFSGIYFGIDGSQESVKWIEQIVKNLGSKPVFIPEGMKPLYHVASVFASNYESILLNAISDLTASMNLGIPWHDLFGKLLTTSMENLIKGGIEKSLTGPVVRNDTETLDLHLKTLDAKAPHLLPLYTVSGVEAARIAKMSGRISDEDFNEIIDKFRKFIQTSSLKKITRGKK